MNPDQNEAIIVRNLMPFPLKKGQRQVKTIPDPEILLPDPLKT
jgi:hypothetical protein